MPLDELFAGTDLDAAHALVAAFFDRYLASLPDDKQHLLRGYRLVGTARKVVGVGSVGTRCWILLLVGQDDSLDDLVLQIKEAVPSVLEPYLGASAYSTHGRRVVEGQRLMQAASDMLLGWEQSANPAGETYDYYVYYVRQMWDGKASADLGALNLEGYQAYSQICGWTLARAHARSGDRRPSRRTSARPTPSTRRWPVSPRNTPTRMSRTTSAYAAPQMRDSSTWRRADTLGTCRLGSRS